MSEKLNIFWFRRDLRLKDNIGFFKALQGKFRVLPIFIFDTNILEELPKDDARLSFIYENLEKTSQELHSLGSGISMYYGKPEQIIEKLLKEYNIQNIIVNRDYEPYARDRDSKIEQLLSARNVGFHSFKDHVIFEKDDIVKADASPYLVYTPYMKKWKEKFKQEYTPRDHEPSKYFKNIYTSNKLPKLSLSDIGFEKATITTPEYDISPNLLLDYESSRNFPAKDATSHIGPHLRFGAVSVREAVNKAVAQTNEVYLDELIWREFFIQILWHFPETTHSAFKKQYDRILWRNEESEFEKWTEGKTGYPMVDAGMRQLNQTGYMHNRVRMLTASFLCKHLLIDWRWGEAYFAQKLLDYDIASNVGNWQWAAGCGVDAAPYFRIFNPTIQLEKFDPKLLYVKKWIPEYGTEEYPTKIIAHKEARDRCLKTYRTALR